MPNTPDRYSKGTSLLPYIFTSAHTFSFHFSYFSFSFLSFSCPLVALPLFFSPYSVVDPRVHSKLCDGRRFFRAQGKSNRFLWGRSGRACFGFPSSCSFLPKILSVQSFPMEIFLFVNFLGQPCFFIENSKSLFYMKKHGCPVCLKYYNIDSIDIPYSS